jgi:hypothetical protein
MHATCGHSTSSHAAARIPAALPSNAGHSMARAWYTGGQWGIDVCIPLRPFHTKPQLWLEARPWCAGPLTLTQGVWGAQAQ